MPRSNGKTNFDRVFGGIASVTFAVQLISVLIIGFAGAMYLFIWTGILDPLLANTDLLILVLLITAGVAFIIFIGLLGFFLRSHVRVRRFIVGGGVGPIEVDTGSTKTILLLFGGAVFFILLAGIYAYYLFWKYLLNPWGTGFINTYIVANPNLSPNLFIWQIGLYVVYIAIGAVVICLLLQILSAAINRYTRRLVEAVD
jgi:hypothetical protein